MHVSIDNGVIFAGASRAHAQPGTSALGASLERASGYFQVVSDSMSVGSA